VEAAVAADLAERGSGSTRTTAEIGTALATRVS
jgi:hypothetical protein